MLKKTTTFLLKKKSSFSPFPPIFIQQIFTEQLFVSGTGLIMANELDNAPDLIKLLL